MIEYLGNQNYSIEKMITLIQRADPEQKIDPNNTKTILENFDSSIAGKKLPLNFKKDLFRIGLILTQTDDDKRYKTIQFLRDH